MARLVASIDIYNQIIKMILEDEREIHSYLLVSCGISKKKKKKIQRFKLINNLYTYSRFSKFLPRKFLSSQKIFSQYNSGLTFYNAALFFFLQKKIFILLLIHCNCYDISFRIIEYFFIWKSPNRRIN